MNLELLHHYQSIPHRPFRTPHRTQSQLVRSASNLPFLTNKAKYHKELEAAVNVVDRACRLCIDVKNRMVAGEHGIVQKTDRTPVTVADFSVQALISFELGKLFPSIPLVAEEDSGFVRANNLTEQVFDAVRNKVSFDNETLTHSVVLNAIDRGGKDAVDFGVEPATYWVLDPIDGTRGFLKGADALYVVGLALVVEGEIVAGVMGCPNWKQDSSDNHSSEVRVYKNLLAGSGIIMAAHVDCGTWIQSLSHTLGSRTMMLDSWSQCFVDVYDSIQQARFCIPESQTWDSMPLSNLFRGTTDGGGIDGQEVILLPTCCGSLCKYMKIASGAASIFIQGTRSHKSIKTWDHAAGVICVHEAGGKVTDWKGSQLDFAADHTERRILFPSGGILITNGNFHNLILEIISSKSTAQ